MDAFDAAWSLLKALPENMLGKIPENTTLGRLAHRRKHFDAPKMAGEHEFNMTMHPAIAGILRRFAEDDSSKYPVVQPERPHGPVRSPSEGIRDRYRNELGWKIGPSQEALAHDPETGARISGSGHGSISSENQSEAVDRANRDRGTMVGIEGFLARGPNFAATDSEGNEIDRMPNHKDTRYDDYDVATRGTETEGLSPYYNIGMIDSDPNRAAYFHSRNPAHVDVPLWRLKDLASASTTYEEMKGEPRIQPFNRPYPELDSVEPYDNTISVLGLDPIELPPSARLPLAEPGVPYTAVMDSM